MPVNQQDDLEALSRRYWAAWGEALRGAASPAGGMPGMSDAAGLAGMPGMSGFAGMNGMPGMAGFPGLGGIPGMGGAPNVPGAHGLHEAIDWWSRVAHGGRGQVDDAVERFNTQARQWYGQMQQVASRFAGQDASAADVARAWKEALGAAGENPFPEMLRTMRGHGMQGLDQWVEDASPWLHSMRSEAGALLRMPTFGFAREQQERQQELLRAHLEYQHANAAYNALMMKASQEAYEIFEARLEAHQEPGRQIQSARALFDTWIDAAEEAYARIALSPEFREVYGEMVNAQMRLRACVQRAVEDACAQVGMPTRSELDGAHRKLAQLEREVRKLRDAVAQGQGDRAPATAPRPHAGAPLEPAARPVAKASGTAKAVRASKRAGTGAAKDAASHVARKATRKSTKVAKSAVKKSAPKKTVKKAVKKSAAKPATAGARVSRAAAPRASRSKAEGFGSMIANAIPQAPRPLSPRGGKSPAKRKR
ncbi:class III poly(R)-hydroxyalkanoic acid synthase subunit PhaE [Luteimonas sp. MC1828]|uniref:class III poly(R)-hydroxyalkanoic acid synthase subunit PhaE n=1 Tax=Luteimonas sp. MC1828 TaxID=2799787 RepID=UPI0018F219E4|nr:class III poly(R)-hydroxyalkanoic acid synthase subunit PhaE [Luteimonas sp. MC1828]MBJ7573992.1 class III poly(R)-hydroxyalkanoic acid synthase subunit PhaE [Luteimonas sp. MC1828]